eukprot:5154296-Pyramimonas_sp.AAC.1
MYWPIGGAPACICRPPLPGSPASEVEDGLSKGLKAMRSPKVRTFARFQQPHDANKDVRVMWSPKVRTFARFHQPHNANVFASVHRQLLHLRHLRPPRTAFRFNLIVNN